MHLHRATESVYRSADTRRETRGRRGIFRVRRGNVFQFGGMVVAGLDCGDYRHSFRLDTPPGRGRGERRKPLNSGGLLSRTPADYGAFTANKMDGFAPTASVRIACRVPVSMTMMFCRSAWEAYSRRPSELNASPQKGPTGVMILAMVMA